MGIDVIPYDPYHPHFGYTAAISCVAWVSIVLFSRLKLRWQPQLRTALYALAIGLPLYAESTSYVIALVRPPPETSLGYLLTHIHASLLQPLPIDSPLSPAMSMLVLPGLAGLLLVSLVRFALSTWRLNRALAGARPMAYTSYGWLWLSLSGMARARRRRLPPVLICSLAEPLAFTTGVIRPRIYITPALLELLTAEEALAVLCHEWGHVQRHDLLWNWLMHTMRDLVWFLPGGHLAWRSMLESQDQACDVLAATMTNRPLAVARALVKVAGARSAKPALPLLAASSFALAGRPLHARVEHMISLYECGEQPARGAAIGAGLLALALLVLAILPVLLGS